jgi:protein gp37
MTLIPYVDEVLPVTTGCTKCSPGCDNCYAARLAATRLKHLPQYEGLAEKSHLIDGDPFGDGYDWSGEIRVNPEQLEKPLHWKQPKKIFVCHTSDLFHKDVPGVFINQVWNMMFNNPRHTYLILTKRPELLLQWTEIKAQHCHWPIEDIWPDWFWLGTTVCNQEEAERNIPVLLQIPAAVRWVSIEPMLGPIDIVPYMGYRTYRCGCRWHRTENEWLHLSGDDALCLNCGELCEVHPGIDWVVLGGESGTNARPMHPDWARWVRDDCKSAGVPFYFKQWGSYVTEDQSPKDIVLPSKSWFPDGWEIKKGNDVYKVGAKAAGSELDGETWKQMPHKEAQNA